MQYKNKTCKEFAAHFSLREELVSNKREFPEFP